MTVKEARQAMHLTQKALSEWLGIPRRTIEDWDSGKSNPPKWVEELLIEKIFNFRKDNIMKFEIIDNTEGNLEYKGFRFVPNSERNYDEVLEKKERIDRGDNFVDRQFDIFCEGFEPICKNEDGKLYSVLFLKNFNSNDKPFIWQEVERV